MAGNASVAEAAAKPAAYTPASRTPAPQSNFAPWKDPAKNPIVRFENVTKRFGDFVAIKDCTLDIYERRLREANGRPHLRQRQGHH